MEDDHAPLVRLALGRRSAPLRLARLGAYVFVCGCALSGCSLRRSPADRPPPPQPTSWQEHCERAVAGARREGRVRVGPRTTREILQAMEYKINVWNAGHGAMLHYLIREDAKRFFKLNHLDALEVARALLRAPDTYRPGQSYYTTWNSLNARRDFFMRIQALLVILFLLDTDALPEIMTAIEREGAFHKAFELDIVRPPDGVKRRYATTISVGVLGSRVLERVAMHEPARWNDVDLKQVWPEPTSPIP